MKIEFEHGDKVLFPVAWDGVHEDTKVYQYGYVEEVSNGMVFLGGGRVVPANDVLPCLNTVRNLMDKVKAAFSSGKNSYEVMSGARTAMSA